MPKIDIHPVTPDRWGDLETLFGPRGACAGCWCMYWRQASREFEELKGEPNRRALRAIVAGGPPPGLLAYADGQPAGWCAVAPRADYPRLERSRILARVDPSPGSGQVEPVWSVPCFFIARAHRRQGITTRLLDAAARYAAAHGARVVEGYPIEPRNPNMPPVFAYTGIASAFRAAGFVEVARRSETRPVMRRVMDE
jgi:GNAT superfamily N-acetyltransferase